MSTTARLPDAVCELMGSVLVDLGEGTAFSQSATNKDWPIQFVNVPQKIDNTITVLDTAPIRNGRYMNKGEEIKQPGFQILVRANDYRTGRNKADSIAVSLTENVKYKTVTYQPYQLPDNVYIISSISLSSGPLSLGKEDSSQRYVFSINGTVSIQYQD